MPPKERQGQPPVEGQADAETAAGAQPPTEGQNQEDSDQQNSGPKRKVARFTGASTTTRIFTTKDFTDAGIEGVEKDIEFSNANKHQVDVSDLPPAAVELMAKQPNIKISERSA